MINCPNKNLSAWKDLVKIQGENKAYLLWNEYDGIVPEEYYNDVTFNDKDILLQIQQESPSEAKRRIQRSLNAINNFISPAAYTNLVNSVGNYNKQIGYQALTIHKASSGNYFIKVHSKLAAQLDSQNEVVNQELNDYLIQFLKDHKIDIQFYENLKGRLGIDAAGAFDIVNQLVLISQSKAKLDTLPEEVGHAIYFGLGEDHTLIQALLKSLDNFDFKALLDQRYIDLYKGDESRLKAEYAGKLIGNAIIDNWNNQKKPNNTILSILKRIIDRFISLFKNSDISRLERAKKDAQDKAGVIVKEAFKKDTKFTFGDTRDTLYYSLSAENKDKSKDSEDRRDKEITKKIIFFNNKIKGLSKRLSKLDEDTAEYEELNRELTDLKAQIEELKSTGNKSIIEDLGKQELYRVKKFMDDVDNDKVKLEDFTDNDLIYFVNIVDQFINFPELSSEALKLKDRLKPYIQKYSLTSAGEFSTREQELTLGDILSENTDINRYWANEGALSDVDDILGQTIGSMIKQSQNRITTADKEITKKIQEEITSLIKYQKDRGVSNKQIYDIFIQEWFGSTVLTRPFTEEFQAELNRVKKLSKQERGKWWKENIEYDAQNKTYLFDDEFGPIPKKEKHFNPNYIKIQNTPELKKFYEFHRFLMMEAREILPTNLNNNFIANVRDVSLRSLVDGKFTQTMKNIISEAIDVQEDSVNGFKADEDLYSDVVPLKYIKKLKSEEKIRDLGEELVKFMQFVNMYKEMSDILPKVRLIQEVIKDKQYIKSNDPKTRIEGEESNIFKIVDEYIKIQVKGQNKDTLKRLNLGTYVDEDGNTIQKYTSVSNIIDFGLKYNSLLRIGFNPITALSNLTFGEISNKIEGFGNRFYNNKELLQASGIYYKEIHDKESKLNKIIELLNPLQELEDYNNINTVKLKSSLDTDKIKEKAFILQKMGENFLQTRTMIASMLHDKVELPDGTKVSLWEAFEVKDGKLEFKGKQTLNENLIGKMSDKIQRLNQLIHGRYSNRDAAVANQYVIHRAIIQFRKWIPTALESRFMGFKYDPRLGVNMEGRYRTLGRITLNTFKGKEGWFKLMSDLIATRNDLTAGKYFSEMEIYNMRKNLIEVVLLLATILFKASVDDDDNPTKDPLTKILLHQLNTAARDLSFFYNPKALNDLAINAIPLAKTTGDILKVMINIPYIFGGKDAEYKKGYRKGENKELAALMDVMVGVKPIADFIRTLKKVPYQSY